MRLIDADKLIELLRDECAEVDDGNRDIDESTCLMTFRAMHEFVNTIPTADVVEVVRCKNCQFAYWENGEPIWCNNFLYAINGNEFCSYGERREDGEIH